MAAKVIKQGFIIVEGFGYEKLNELTFLCGKEEDQKLGVRYKFCKGF